MRLLSLLLSSVIGLSPVSQLHAESDCEEGKRCPDGVPAVTPRKNAAGDAERQLLAQKLASAHAMADKRRYDGADIAFRSAIESRAFASLPPAQIHAALSAAAQVAVMRDEPKRAIALYERAIAIDENDPDDRYSLFLLSNGIGQYEVAAKHYIQLAARWPELLGNVDMRPLYLTLRNLGRYSDLRLALLQALYDARWDDPVSDASFVWYELALLRVERGEFAEARAAIKRITAPRQVVQMRIDKRFDAIADRESWMFDISTRTTRAVEVMRRKVDRAPKRIDVLVQYSYALLVAGRNDEVIGLVDEVSRRIASAPVSEPPYERIESLVWLMNNRVLALRRVGRIDEAVNDLANASEFTENGHRNVSQALNLGSLLCRMGRADEAEASIDRVDEAVSNYGRMVESSIHLCIARVREDRRGVARALTLLRRRADDAPIVFLDSLLDAQREGEAARHLIALFDSPEQRDEALLWVQTFRRAAPLSGDHAWYAQRDRLLARDDVRATIARFGRIEHYDINIEYDF